MFFFKSRHVKQGKAFLKDASKLLAYKRDLWSEAKLSEFESAMGKLQEAVRGGERKAIETAIEQLDKQATLNAKPRADAAWRENCEVFLVAIVVALGVRTYFLQPFTIPTGSMQPTLNGILGYRTTEPPPNPLVQILQTATHGRTWVDVVSLEDDVIVELEEIKRWRFFVRTNIITAKGHVYTVDCPKFNLERDILTPPREFKAGEVIARGYWETGDHVFVDKFSYHFRKPRRGDVFVFNTKAIPTGHNGQTDILSPSQFYIKRLAGLPGDELEISSPVLNINGARATEPGFERVMSGTDGYRGYSNEPLRARYLRRPNETFKLDEKSYFALGDNSYNSSDSRYWGAVPQQNIMGRAVTVYWPFVNERGSHWGLIK